MLSGMDEEFVFQKVYEEVKTWENDVGRLQGWDESGACDLLV